MESLCAVIRTFGHDVYLIDTPNWKFQDFKDLMKPGAVFVFDTAVGFGEFGETQPQEAALEKWQNAHGIMQVVKGTDTGVQVMFSVIQKFVNDPDIIKKFLMYEQKCNRCNLMKKHVNISNYSNSVICQDCVQELLN